MQFVELHICFATDILLELEYNPQILSSKSTTPKKLLVIPTYIIYTQLYGVYL